MLRIQLVLVSIELLCTKTKMYIVHSESSLMHVPMSHLLSLKFVHCLAVTTIDTVVAIQSALVLRKVPSLFDFTWPSMYEFMHEYSSNILIVNLIIFYSCFFAKWDCQCNVMYSFYATNIQLKNVNCPYLGIFCQNIKQIASSRFKPYGRNKYSFFSPLKIPDTVMRQK